MHTRVPCLHCRGMDVDLHVYDVLGDFEMIFTFAAEFRG